MSAGAASLQRFNTKSSSSSDSLPYHKYNTMARLEANVLAAPATGDLYYAVSGTQPLHPLMYAANRPIGGSQILVDPYDPQMYKSDSKASILSEFSFAAATTRNATLGILIGDMAGASVIPVCFQCTQTLAKGGTLEARKAGSDTIVDAAVWMASLE